MEKVIISKENIEKALLDGAKTMTELYRALGGKSKASGSFSKQIRETLPNVDSRFKENQGVKPAVQPVHKIKSTSTRLNPFRPDSAYALVWDCLYKTREKGISREALLKKVMELSKMPENNCRFNISVVTSPKEDGTAHRSAKRASDIYWVERQNDWLNLHLRDRATNA